MFVNNYASRGYQMKFRNFLILFLLLSTVLYGCSSNEFTIESLTRRRLEDFEYLYELIVNDYREEVKKFAPILSIGLF